MATLSGPYQIDRVTPPQTFYTPKRRIPAHASCRPGVDVLTATENHNQANEGWVVMGYVSKQTPFGQGTWMGMRRNDLRQATPDEIRLALTRDHPYSPKFRPTCTELQDAGFSLLMSGPTAPQGWTADRVRPGSRPVVPLTRKQIEQHGRSVQQRYQQILADWDNITSRQIAAILKSLG